MKIIKFIFIVSLIMCISSCNNQTIVSYNNTIVSAHEELLKINQDFSMQYEQFLEKSKSKAEFMALISKTKTRIAEAKKTVEALIPINDEGLRAKMLDMFDAYDNSMLVFKVKIDTLTNPALKSEAIMLLLTEFHKLKELDDEIREIQLQYAANNNTQIR